MKNYPIWDSNKEILLNNVLKENYVDILIIGGGITGLTTAYFLMNSNQNILLIDKDKLGVGATYKSTAKISYLQKDIYQKLEKTYNYHTSKLYYESQIEAIKLIKDIIRKEKISCDLEKCKCYLFTTKKKNIKKIQKEKEILEKFGVTCYDSNSLPIPYKIEGSFYVDDTYTFNPKKYTDELSNILNSKIQIVEDTIAFNISKDNDLFQINTNKGIITAKKVVVATHYPFFIFPNLLPLRNYISREYVNAGKYKTKENFTAINVDKNTESIRFYHDNIIYVSNNHRLTNHIDYQKMYEKSRKDFNHKFMVDIDYSWMNQDLMTNDYLPIIGYSNQSDKNLLLATGFNAWGITNGVIAAKVMSNLILTGSNPYKNLFRPNRINVTGILNSIIDVSSYAKVYTQTLFYKKDYIYTVKLKNQKYFLYVDNKGKRHYVKTKCPHMKCNLVLNKEELTWDCPCHGSRFDLDGNIIEGPTKNNISKE